MQAWQIVKVEKASMQKLGRSASWPAPIGYNSVSYHPAASFNETITDQFLAEINAELLEKEVEPLTITTMQEPLENYQMQYARGRNTEKVAHSLPPTNSRDWASQQRMNFSKVSSSRFISRVRTYTHEQSHYLTSQKHVLNFAWINRRVLNEPPPVELLQPKAKAPPPRPAAPTEDSPASTTSVPVPAEPQSPAHASEMTTVQEEPRSSASAAEIATVPEIDPVESTAAPAEVTTAQPFAGTIMWSHPPTMAFPIPLMPKAAAIHDPAPDASAVPPTIIDQSHFPPVPSRVEPMEAVPPVSSAEVLPPPVFRGTEAETTSSEVPPAQDSQSQAPPQEAPLAEEAAADPIPSQATTDSRIPATPQTEPMDSVNESEKEEEDD